VTWGRRGDDGGQFRAVLPTLKPEALHVVVSNPVRDSKINAIAMDHLEAWNVSVHTITPRLERLRREWSPAKLAELTPSRLTGLVFLYVKAFLDTHVSASRKLQFSEALGIVPPDATEAQAKPIRAKGERFLNRLLGQPGDTTFPEAPADWHSLTLLTQAPGLDAWANSTTSRVFFRDVVPGCEVQRVQKSGLCYMHGSDVVVHYAVAKGTGREDHK
jgi:hypothetical protein